MTVEKRMPGKQDERTMTEKEYLKKLENMVASEPDEVEVIEIPSLLMQYEDWKNENPKKTYDDFLEENGLKRKKLSNGGSAEDYADLIDSYEKGIDVMEGESLTHYIKRIKAAEKD